MGTKQVRRPEDVYAKVEDEKRPDGSFSDAINRLIPDWSLAEWAGWMILDASFVTALHTVGHK